MRNHLSRLLSGALFVVITVVTTETCLNRAWTTSPGSLWKQAALLGLLAVWMASAGAVLGALIHYDLRRTVRETSSDRFLRDMRKHMRRPSDV